MPCTIQICDDDLGGFRGGRLNFLAFCLLVSLPAMYIEEDIIPLGATNMVDCFFATLDVIGDVLK
jgi:hypothetical protein